MEQSSGTRVMVVLAILLSAQAVLGLEVPVNAVHPQAGVGSNLTGVYGDWPYLYGGGSTGNINLTFNTSTIQDFNVNSSNTSRYAENAQNSTYSTNSTYALNATYADTCNTSDYSNRTVYWDGSDSKQDVIQWCYQGLVNKSTSCGGLGYGVYFCGDNWTDCVNSIDGDWDTYSTQGDYNQYIYINTTLPINLLGDSLMQVKDGMAIATTNVSISSVCDLKQFRLLGQNAGGGITPYSIQYQCWNTTDWQTLRTKSCAQPCRVYDTGWWLHLNNTEQNKISYGEANELYRNKTAPIDAATLNGKTEDALDVNNSVIAGTAYTALYLEGFTYGQINASAVAAANAFTSSQVGAVIANATNFNVNNASWAYNATSFDNELHFASLGQSIVPSADNSINLGSASKRWNSLYLGTGGIRTTGFTAIVGTGETSVAMQSPDNTKARLKLYPSSNSSRIINLDFNPITDGNRGLVLWIEGGGDDYQFIPFDNGKYKLGDSTHQWWEVWGVYAALNDTFHMGNKDYIIRTVERQDGLYTQYIPRKDVEALSSSTSASDVSLALIAKLGDELWNSTNKTKQGMDGNIVSYSGSIKTLDLKEIVDENKALKANYTQLKHDVDGLKLDVAALKMK